MSRNQLVLIFTLAWLAGSSLGFHPSAVRRYTVNPKRQIRLPVLYTQHQNNKSENVPQETNEANGNINAVGIASEVSFVPFLAALIGTPAPAYAAAGPIPSAVFAWLHFLGIFGVAGGLITERLVLKKNMSVDEENVFNGADLIYGISAFSLLISGYFRVTEYAKGWDFYKNEPIFWVKMASVAVLGALSFFPAIIMFQRDMARKNGATLPPLPDEVVDRMSTIINAELLAIATIPLFASLMARGVGYTEGFPWALGIALYAISLGGAGFKYGKEAFDAMEEKKLLVPIEEE